ncbi:MAG: non-hydrolyzing UDP-N-acetylglucosamine 2-epimerase [Candidatus Bipolaricaulaceae bacterium]
MLRVLIVLGTRPEAIKLAPVIRALSARGGEVVTRVCLTAQHREMLDPMLELLGVTPDIDLNLMRPGQQLSDLAARVLTGLTPVLEAERPDFVLVQGDTTTAVAAALAAFHLRIPVGHVEAGLRTGDSLSPFPEEANRRMITALAALHFAPTRRAAERLIAEGVSPRAVYLTGNTVVDAVRWMLATSPSEAARRLLADLGFSPAGDAARSPVRLVLATAHRRESFGPPFGSICRGLRAIAEGDPDVLVVYPVHLNPQVRGPVWRTLADHPRVKLLEPLPYEPFTRLLAAAYLVLTDSGGIQEEASVLGKPVLVLREVTERPEILEAGIGKLVGTSAERIAGEAHRLLSDQGLYRSMARRADLFGDGRAGERIVSALLGKPLQPPAPSAATTGNVSPPNGRTPTEKLGP